MKALTLEGWNIAGYRVKRGEKSATRNGKGEPTFTRDQVQDESAPMEPRVPDTYIEAEEQRDAILGLSSFDVDDL